MRKVLSNKIEQGIRWLLQRPIVNRFRLHYPRLANFIAQRFNTKNFWGLPFTLSLLVFGFNLLLLSELAESVLESEGVVTLDKAFTAFLFSVRLGWLSQIFFGITQLGGRPAVFIVGGIITIGLAIKRKFIPIICFWLVMIGVGLSVDYGKVYFNRARPIDVAFYPESNLSFPSGHATTAMALFGFCAYFSFMYFRNKAYWKLLIWISIMLIGLISFSRIYLGVHYLSDVLAGILLGALWLLVGISLIEMLALKFKSK